MWYYLALSALSEPVWRFGLQRRVKKGREDPERLPERFGRSSIERPAGQLIWFHALSVGEALALLTLLKRLGEDLPDAHFLLTTTTTSAAAALQANGLPPRVIHQFAPVDAPGPTRRFLAHWKPDISIWSELDLWPRLIRLCHRIQIPLLLINTRISDKQFRSRQRFSGLFRQLLHCFQHILVQNDDSYARSLTLGADPGRMRVVGGLKGAADPLPDHPKERAELEKSLGNRPRWLAAATEEREEEAVFEAHHIAQKTEPNLLLMIAPRNPGQADVTEEKARKLFDNVARRSKDQPITPQTQVYIADTFGEMGLWYRLCPITFIGHTMAVEGEPLPGKNPYEAAQLDSAILHGPSYTHFVEDFESLDERGAANLVSNTGDIAQNILLGQSESWRSDMCSNAKNIANSQQNALRETIATILDTLR